MSVRECPNVSTTPVRQWGFRQCLPFRGKHCWHPIAIMGVVDTFGLLKEASIRLRFVMSVSTHFSCKPTTQHIEVTLAVVEAVQCTLMHFGHNHYSLLFEVKF